MPRIADGGRHDHEPGRLTRDVPHQCPLSVRREVDRLSVAQPDRRRAVGPAQVDRAFRASTLSALVEQERRPILRDAAEVGLIEVREAALRLVALGGEQDFARVDLPFDEHVAVFRDVVNGFEVGRHGDQPHAAGQIRREEALDFARQQRKEMENP